MIKYLFLFAVIWSSCRSKTEISNEIKYFDLVSNQLDTNDYLIRVSDQSSPFELGVPFAFVNQSGDTVIPLDKYNFTWTDTLKSFAIVSKSGSGMIGIDQKENILFEVFRYDNGPDYIAEGLFRVIRNGKVGYADQYGVVVIPCQYECAYYFENGKAKVSNDCQTIKDGEYNRWESDAWYYIDKTGKIIN